MPTGFTDYLVILEAQINRMSGHEKYKELVLLSWEYLQLENVTKSRNLLTKVLLNEEYMDKALFFDLEFDDDFRWALSDLLETFGTDMLQEAKQSGLMSS